uniref:Uncharacterized protein n=1 Tax=Anguilla anguilla TaxID=7936 RepID=A0A0E9XHA1_ANGAN
MSDPDRQSRIHFFISLWSIPHILKLKLLKLSIGKAILYRWAITYKFTFLMGSI